MLTTRQKQHVIGKLQKHKTDTGSPEVQVGILSKRIKELTNHLKTNKKDLHSRRGLLKMVSERRKHLKYLQKVSVRRYNALLKKVGLKK